MVDQSNSPVIPPDVAATSLPGWFLRGAIREDDAYGEGNPQDDKYPANATLRRPLHHFYDPYKNKPLTRFGLAALDSDVHKAPDWAIGSRDVFNDPNTAESGRRNHFTVFDAREAMYRALTGRRGSDGGPVTPDGTPANEVTRKAYWATTFRALGDVVHLIQDMAQPQHTRNEPHSGKGPTFLTGHTSIFEKYIDAPRLLVKSFFSIAPTHSNCPG